MYVRILSVVVAAKIASKMRLVELQSLCEEQGITHAGFNKADLMALLKEAEAGQVDRKTGGYGDEGSDSEDEEGSADEATSVESEAIVALRFQVKLAKMELERKKVNAAAKQYEQSVAGANFKSVLPKMETDVLAFFVR